MIINKNIEISDFCPFVHTEETIIKDMLKCSEIISDEYELMPYPLAHWLNTYDVKNTNEILSRLNSDRKRVFICQHIFVSRLNFKSDDIVFTPHSTTSDNFISIPHFSINFDKKYIKNEKKYKFSFMGSINTHKIREQLVNRYPENCIDSGQKWGLDKNISTDFNERYMELIGDSYFSLCPRGTGISSIRLFECIQMNSIPVIIADGYKKPLSDILDWNDFSITIPESDLDKIEYIINSLSKDDIKNLQENLSRVNELYINNDISNIIKKNLNKK